MVVVGSAAGRKTSPGPIVAAVTDLDGTLLRSDGTLSLFTRSVFLGLQRKGVPLVVATARTPRAMRRISGYQDLGVVVCANGTIVWDASCDAVIAERCFDAATLIEALERVRAALPAAGFAVLSADTMFIDNTYRHLRGNGTKDAELVADVTAVAERERIAMVALRHPDRVAAEFIDATTHAFGNVGAASYASVPTVDICPAGNAKPITVAEVLSQRGCPPEATVAFGDMPNDLPLLAWAGRAYAVRNAHHDVLQIADEVIPSNDDDGVARTLHRLFQLAVTA